MLIVLLTINLLSAGLYSLFYCFLFALSLSFPAVFSLVLLSQLYPAVDYFWSAWIISVGSWVQCQRKWSKLKKKKEKKGKKRKTDTSKCFSSSWMEPFIQYLCVYLEMVFQVFNLDQSFFTFKHNNNKNKPLICIFPDNHHETFCAYTPPPGSFYSASNAAQRAEVFAQDLT